MTREEELRLRGRALQLMIQQREKQEAPEAWYEDFGEGLGVSALSTYGGIKQLLGTETEEDRERLADWKRDAAQSGWGTAGQVVGEAAQMAVPGGLAFKGLKAAAAAKNIANVGWKARTALDAGLSAAHGGLQATEDGESHLGNALSGGAFGVLGGAAGAGIGKALKGIRKTKEAQKLIDEGVRLTPGQAAEGGLVQALEALGQWTVGIGKPILKARRGALEDWNVRALQAAAPKGVNISDYGVKGFNQLKNSIDDAYAKAWSKVEAPGNEKIFSIISKAHKAQSRLGPDQRRTIEFLNDDLVDLSESFTKEKLLSLDKSIRNQMNKAIDAKEFDLVDTLKEMRSNLRAAGSRETEVELKLLDRKYPRFLALARAASRKIDARGEPVDPSLFSPEDLRAALRSMSSPVKYATQRGSLFNLADLGSVTVGRKSRQPLIDVRKAIVQHIPGPDLGDGFRRFVLGETDFQKGSLRNLNKLADALRQYGVSPATAAQAYAASGE